MLSANVNRLLLLLRMVLDVTLVIDKLTLKRYCAMNQNMKHCNSCRQQQQQQ
jgi:hypothetical protein